MRQGAAFAMAQKINALLDNCYTLVSKGLPETEDQALVYLFMASSSDASETMENSDDFICLFPNNA